MKRTLLLAILAAGLSQAQTFQPDPNEPGAQDFAQRQYLMSQLGMTSPPVGWVCSVSIPDPTTWAVVECYPDHAVLAEQEEARRRWYQEFRERSARVRRR